MIKMIHALTGSIMWVHETRVEDYLARGHKMAPPPPPPPKPKRTPRKKPEGVS